jgi:hypothetical protein
MPTPFGPVCLCLAELAKGFHQTYEYIHEPSHQEQANYRESDARYEQDDDDFPMSEHAFLPKSSRSG